MTKRLHHRILRLSKEDTSFLYFTLESNEGIAFYSTLPFEQAQEYRDVTIKCPIELKPQLDGILEHFKLKTNYEEIKSEIIEDLA